MEKVEMAIMASGSRADEERGKGLKWLAKTRKSG